MEDQREERTEEMREEVTEKRQEEQSGKSGKKRAGQVVAWLICIAMIFLVLWIAYGR